MRVLPLAAAVLLVGCTVEVTGPGVRTPVADTSWDPPQQMFETGDYQTEDFFIGENKWVLCASIEDVSRPGRPGKVTINVREARSPNLVRESWVFEGGIGAGDCRLVRTPPGRYYLDVRSADSWHINVGRASPQR